MRQSKRKWSACGPLAVRFRSECPAHACIFCGSTMVAQPWWLNLDSKAMRQLELQKATCRRHHRAAGHDHGWRYAKSIWADHPQNGLQNHQLYGARLQ